MLRCIRLPFETFFSHNRYKIPGWGEAGDMQGSPKVTYLDERVRAFQHH